MKSKIILLIAGLAFVLILAAATVFYQDLSEQYSVDPFLPVQDAPAEDTTVQDSGNAQEKEPIIAPDFTVFDADGNAVKLSDYLGQPVVINFWASWCGPCKSEMPAFQQVWETYGDQVQFLLINLTDNNQETVSSAQAFLETSGYTFPVYFDTQLSAAIAYGVVGIPTTYFIDENGHVITGASSALGYETLEYGISLILEDK